MKKKPPAGSIVPVFPQYFKVVMTRMLGSRTRIFARRGEPARPVAPMLAAQAEPYVDDGRYCEMSNEEYSMELFLAVGLIAATLAGAASLFEARSSSAANTPSTPTEMARLEPVRVVGTPFVPNVRPSER